MNAAERDERGTRRSLRAERKKSPTREATRSASELLRKSGVSGAPEIFSGEGGRRKKEEKKEKREGKEREKRRDRDSTQPVNLLVIHFLRLVSFFSAVGSTLGGLGGMFGRGASLLLQ